VTASGVAPAQRIQPGLFVPSHASTWRGACRRTGHAKRQGGDRDGCIARYRTSDRRALARDGFDVVVNYARSADEAEAVAAGIGERAIAVQADLASLADVRRMIRDTRARFGSHRAEFP
jgi:hypothetical protein